MKTKTFKSKFSDMKIEFTCYGKWACIADEYNQCISLGVYPNARWDLIEKALEYAKKMEKKHGI